mmetsp:Transcript_7489/g.21172  ORF Transcript_7489/g.21172 Transcript_7489/m.21172 type:complete len:598 (-) Transcript_7489:525-2318(-)
MASALRSSRRALLPLAERVPSCVAFAAAHIQPAKNDWFPAEGDRGGLCFQPVSSAGPSAQGPNEGAFQTSIRHLLPRPHSAFLRPPHSHSIRHFSTSGSSDTRNTEPPDPDSDQQKQSEDENSGNGEVAGAAGLDESPLHDALRSDVPVAQQKVQADGWGGIIRDFYRDVISNERILAISGSTAIMAMCHTALGPVLPVFAKDFGVSAAAIGATVSAFALARLVLNLPSGVVADKIGRRPLLIVGPAITAVGMVGSGLAGTFPELLAWRFLTGMGSAMQMAGSQLYLADVSSTVNRARMLGTNQVAGLLGVSFGPAVGGLLADSFGLRAPFFAVGLASGVAAVYSALRLPETHPGILKRQAAKLQSKTLHDSSGHQPPLEPAEKRKAGSEKREEPPGWKLLLICTDFRAIALVNCVLFMTVNGTRAVLMPLMGVESFGFSPSVLGAMFASMAALNVVGVLPAAAAADRFGRKHTIVPAGMGLGLSLLMMAGTTGLGQEAFWASALVFAAMNSAIGPSPAAYAADVIPRRTRGLGLGLYRSAGDVGLLLGPPLLGAVADMSTVGTAMAVNAGMLITSSAFFQMYAREVKQLAGPNGNR